MYIDEVINAKPINIGTAKHVPITPPTSESDMINETNHFLPHVKSNRVAIDSYSSKKTVYLQALQKDIYFWKSGKVRNSNLESSISSISANDM